MTSPSAGRLKSFRFGLLLDSREASPATVRELAQRAEQSGFATILGTDHVGRWATPFMLLAAADATSTLRIGTFVLNNDLRNPVLLAQELATIDLLTDGRLEVGLGAGWMATDYEGTGIPLDPPGTRLQRLVSTISLLKQAFAEGRVDRPASDVYPAARVASMPKTLQRPHPPLLLGGGGGRLLALAAREANIISLNPRSTPAGRLNIADADAQAVDQKIATVRQAAGDRWADLELNANLLAVNPDPNRPHGPAAQFLAEMTPDALRASPHFLFGDTSAMETQLQERRARWGLSYIVVRQADFDALVPLASALAGR